MNHVPLKKNKINSSERGKIKMTFDYEKALNERLSKLEKVQWFEVAEWLEKDDFKGLYYSHSDGMFPTKLTRATRLRVSELATYKWYFEK